MWAQMADGILVASSYASKKFEEHGLNYQAHLTPAVQPQPVSGAIKRTASGARQGAAAIASAANMVCHPSAAPLATFRHGHNTSSHVPAVEALESHYKVAVQVVNAAAAVPVYVVEKLGRKVEQPAPGKPPGARKQVVTASAVSFTVGLL